MRNKRGFTIIEVVLVLAIAGLIFLMVFIALPALQRSQRNTQREDDLSRFVTAATDYQKNNKGKLPFYFEGSKKIVDEKYVPKYIDSSCILDPESSVNVRRYTDCSDQFTDPDGTIYKMQYMNDAKKLNNGNSFNAYQGSWEESDHRVRAYTTAKCGDEGTMEISSGNRGFALTYVMEGGAVRCNDNS